MATKTVKVWDIIVRLTHWGLALCVLLNLWVTDGGSNLHQWGGYTAIVIVVVRLIWAVVGTKYARFSDFFPTWSKIKQHVHLLSARLPDPHLGHNPLGALMMFALWATVIGLGVTGYLMTTDAFWGEDWVEELHEGLANALTLFVILHVLAVIIMQRLTKTKLVQAMITGRKDSVDRPMQ